MAKYKGISRIDSKHTHGWYVRIYGDKRVLTSKLFSDRLYGGKEEALANAIKFRDHNQMVADIKYPSSSRKKGLKTKPPVNNQSGVVGVHFTEKLERGKRIPTWVATWTENGKPKSKSFYQRAHRTLEEAFEQAVAYRKKMESRQGVR
ncbi:MAG TPA: AP2 domain-containing protein [Caldithrix abyssi]|uniref:AP2 domain-containing protein n=1 Tax=Caldithrix abyssi TaxID=187145 RepID=A0A7V1PVP1_CALAY|nr:AP2 domain-containing protein [Caldithrix abyssi]